MEEIKIPLSKRKNILMIAGCIAFVVMGFWTWSGADEQTRHLPIYAKFISVVTILFFGTCLIVGLIKIFDRRPGLIINSKGIQDNSSIGSGRFIPWQNITGFQEIAIRRTKIILIYINNANEMIKRESKWKQKMMNFSLRSYGTPLSISSGTLQITSDKLLKILLDAKANADLQTAN